MSNPFVYADAVSFTKKEIIDTPAAEAGYIPFMVNKAMSYHHDAIMAANAMNMNGHIDNKMQFDYLLHKLNKRKRFAKWAKPMNDLDIDAIMEYYRYSRKKAEQVLGVLSQDQIQLIHAKIYKGD